VLLRAILGLLVLVSGGALFNGCDNTFDPKAEFKEELIVFAVLDNTRPDQYVRLETTYDAELGNLEAGSGRQFDSAVVVLREGGSKWIFRDTSIVLSDNRTQRVWYHPDVPVVRNREYRLLVEVDGFEAATSSLHVPSSPQVQIRVKHTKLKIDKISLESAAGYYVVQPKGHMFRLELVYQDTVDGEYVNLREVVPINIEADGSNWIYPGVSREDTQVYEGQFVLEALSRLTPDKARYTRVGAVAYMYNIDSDFYNYYKISRGFEDPNTVRLDMPDYTNISGARGIFGVVYGDSTSMDLFRIYRP